MEATTMRVDLNLEQVMNEATLESQIADALRRIFPSFNMARLQAQKTFKIRTGRQILTVDGVAEHVSGRLDLLVEIDGKPIVLLEIKSPVKGISQGDADQALSY